MMQCLTPTKNNQDAKTHQFFDLFWVFWVSNVVRKNLLQRL